MRFLFGYNKFIFALLLIYTSLAYPFVKCYKVVETSNPDVPFAVMKSDDVAKKFSIYYTNRDGAYTGAPYESDVKDIEPSVGLPYVIHMLHTLAKQKDATVVGVTILLCPDLSNRDLNTVEIVFPCSNNDIAGLGSGNKSKKVSAVGVRGAPKDTALYLHARPLVMSKGPTTVATSDAPLSTMLPQTTSEPALSSVLNTTESYEQIASYCDPWLCVLPNIHSILTELSVSYPLINLSTACVSEQEQISGGVCSVTHKLSPWELVFNQSDEDENLFSVSFSIPEDSEQTPDFNLVNVTQKEHDTLRVALCAGNSLACIGDNSDQYQQQLDEIKRPPGSFHLAFTTSTGDSLSGDMSAMTVSATDYPAYYKPKKQLGEKDPSEITNDEIEKEFVPVLAPWGIELKGLRQEGLEKRIEEMLKMQTVLQAGANLSSGYEINDKNAPAFVERLTKYVRDHAVK